MYEFERAVAVSEIVRAEGDTFEGTDAVLVDYQDYHEEIQRWHACLAPHIPA